jgi:hypothetical protein
VADAGATVNRNDDMDGDADDDEVEVEVEDDDEDELVGDGKNGLAAPVFGAARGVWPPAPFA